MTSFFDGVGRMEQWGFWIATTVLGLLVGALGWFIKKQISDIMAGAAQNREEFSAQMRQTRADFQSKMEDIRNDFKAAIENQDKRFEKIESAINDMPYKYTLKEDFIRSMGSVEKKLDQIIAHQHEQGR
jgi:Mg2+ and Co2+ transporter CorA